MDYHFLLLYFHLWFHLLGYLSICLRHLMHLNHSLVRYSFCFVRLLLFLLFRYLQIVRLYLLLLKLTILQLLLLMLLE